MNIIYIDHLSVLSLLYLYFQRMSYSHVCYFHVSPGIKRIVELCIKRGIIRLTIQKVNFHLGNIKDKRGGSLYEKINKDIIAICRRIREKELVNNSLIIEFKKYFEFKKLILFFQYSIDEEISEPVFLFHAAIWHKMEHYGRTTGPLIFYSKKRLFSKYLSEYSRTLKIETKYYPTVVNPAIWKYFRSVCRLIKEKIAAGLRQTKKQKSKFTENKTNLRRNNLLCISALYTGKSMSFNLNKRSDCFWFLMSNIPRENILIYFDSIEVPEPEKSVDKMKKEGIGFINIRNKATTTDGIPTYNSSETSKNVRNNLLKIMFKTYIRNMLKLNFIPSVYIIYMYFFILKYAYWYDFFESNNIKINMNQNVFSKESFPELLALESVGGVNVAYQYTNINFFADYGFMLFSDVLFLFGPDYRRVIEDSDAIIDNVIYCGFITDYAFSRVKDDAQKLRNQLTNNGAKFIVCYFDENSSDDKMSMTTNAMSSYIYNRLLDFILSNETLGLICNPKFPNNLLIRIPEIKILMDKVERTGRVIFLGGSRTTDNYPTEAAQAADICIGHLLGGTTILESYLSGIPSVFLDLEKLYTLDIYNWGKGKVVFDDIDELFNAIQKYRKNPGSIPGFGDLELWVKKKDPFKDGNAALRVGQYIKWLYVKLEDGNIKEDAIEYANQKYIELWGKENVKELIR